jgi:hypothetical protein
MTESVTTHCRSAAKPVSRTPATVSASALALHLDLSRTYIGKLKAEGVIQRQGDGFPPMGLFAILAARAAAIAARCG